MFVLMFGLLGILALFPVGLDASRASVENSCAAIVGDAALEYLKVDPGIVSQFPSYTQPGNNIGTLSAIVDDAEDDKLDCLVNGANPGWTANAWQTYVFMLTSGRFAGKVYEITANTANRLTFGESPANPTVLFDPDRNGSGDDVVPGTSFIILGKKTNTIPGTVTTNFFDTNPRVLHRSVWIEALNPPQFIVPYTNPNTEYSFVVILSGITAGMTDVARADILVYRNFTTSLRPERNPPPVRTFVTQVRRN
ncbi:MAG: hypothetical protein HYU36_21235 [Planctomycetes bacterium]|nr:hypothetical protein [Planctomycetota bacterium]